MHNATFYLLPPRATRPDRGQGGVVLIMALIMLVVISMMAVMSVRNASSSEGVNANVRQTQLANQAAETALRYCEDAVLGLIPTGVSTATFTSSPPASTTVTFSASYIDDFRTTPLSISTTFWDSTGSSNPNVILVLPASSVNRLGITSTFSRSPECIVERTVPSSATSTYSKSFNITARGFGPEVSAADSTRSRPTGSEVWMQSSLELN